MSVRSTLVLLVLAAPIAACGPADPRVSPGSDGGFVPLPDSGLPACRGNNDGVVSRDEVVFAPGVEVRYRINPPDTLAPVDVQGQGRPDGTHVWDFSSDAGDVVSLSLVEAGGQWFAPSFPGAQYAARLDPRTSVVGVYRADASEVDLLGAASEAETDGTLLRYDRPLPILRFPLRVGDSWSTEATVLDGRVGGTPVASRDRYDVTVDASGELRLGILTFARTLRVRVEVTQHFPAGPGTRRIQYLWLTECYGEVARITSQDGEVDPSFGQAVEYRRLGF